MISSVMKMLNYDIDVVIPSLFIGEIQYEFFDNPKTFKGYINNCIECLRAGQKHWSTLMEN